MPAKKAPQQLYVANTTGFITGTDGAEYMIKVGQTMVGADHAAYQAAPNFFDRAEDRALGVEQMTAAPGEERGA